MGINNVDAVKELMGGVPSWKRYIHWLTVALGKDLPRETNLKDYAKRIIRDDRYMRYPELQRPIVCG